MFIFLRFVHRILSPIFSYIAYVCYNLVDNPPSPSLSANPLTLAFLPILFSQPLIFGYSPRIHNLLLVVVQLLGFITFQLQASLDPDPTPPDDGNYFPFICPVIRLNLLRHVDRRSKA